MSPFVLKYMYEHVEENYSWWPVRWARAPEQAASPPPPATPGRTPPQKSESAVSTSSSLFASLLWIIEQSGLLLGVLPVQPPAMHHLVIIEYSASKAGIHSVEARQQ
jgi:hypothetical protein